MTKKEAANLLKELSEFGSHAKSAFCESLNMGASALERVGELEAQVEELQEKARAFDLLLKDGDCPGHTGDECKLGEDDGACLPCLGKVALAQAKEEIEKEATK